MELVFLKAYGKIQCHLWFGLGYLLIGFASGRVLVLSTDPNAIGRELYSSQLFTTPVTHMSFCPYAARARELLFLSGPCFEVSTQPPSTPYAREPV